MRVEVWRFDDSKKGIVDMSSRSRSFGWALALVTPPVVQSLFIGFAFATRNTISPGASAAVGMLALLVSASLGYLWIAKVERRRRVWLAIIYFPVMIWLLVAFTIGINGAVFGNWL